MFSTDSLREGPAACTVEFIIAITVAFYIVSRTPLLPCFGPSSDLVLVCITLRMAADVESSQASSKAYPSVAEPSAPDYGAYREQQYGESCGLEGASEHQAFYGYRATADDYNSEYSWSQVGGDRKADNLRCAFAQRGPSSDHESAEERYEHTTSSEPRRASRSADISPEAAVRALLYHGACYTVQCIRRAGTWVGIKLCNHIER